jgi:hypothetical protein
VAGVAGRRQRLDRRAAAVRVEQLDLALGADVVALEAAVRLQHLDAVAEVLGERASRSHCRSTISIASSSRCRKTR